MIDKLGNINALRDLDILVIGSGAAGLTAAIVAAKHGQRVAVIEKDALIGGTTALSGGFLWVPGNPVSRRAGVADTQEQASRYLRHELGTRYVGPMVDAFLEDGPLMVEFLEEHTAVRFFAAAIPDYHSDAPGALEGGRSIGIEPIDGRPIRDIVEAMRPPLRETTFFGVKIGSGGDLRHFFAARRSLRSAAYVARRITRSVFDRFRYGQDMSISNGGALVARLAMTARDLGIAILPSCPALELVSKGGRIAGVVIEVNGERREVKVGTAVFLACGGFPHDLDLRRAIYPHHPGEAEHRSLAPRSNTGDGIRMARLAGALFDDDVAHPAGWYPVSVHIYRNGDEGVVPHSIDRGKPGVIAVSSSGQRFTSEGCSYHDFVAAMIKAGLGGPSAPCFLVCDADFIARYGLGLVLPSPMPRRPYQRSGYLSSGQTLRDLARVTGIDPAGLEATVERFNRDAASGRDGDFGKGSTAYQRFVGDPARAHPSLSPIRSPPFFSIRIQPGDLATFAGLSVDAHGRVLDRARRPIEGMYAVGNDMASVLRGNYVGGGATLGPGMTFAYIAARHAAGHY